ncbi:MAG: hypothetical protein V1813_02660 [Candidatus Aenigmatarchaeota archaeon]
MAQSAAFGGMSDGSIADVHFSEGSVLTRKAGIIPIGSIISAGPQDLSGGIKRNLLYTRMAGSAPLYEDIADDPGEGKDQKFLSKCLDFEACIAKVDPVGFAMRGIGYVSGSGTALSISMRAGKNDVAPLRYGVSPECLGSVSVHRDGRSYGNARWKDIIPVEIELKEESVLTGKAGIVKLSEMLYPDFYDGCKDVSEKDKMKVIEAMMKRRSGEGYPKEAIEILGAERMDRIKYLWVLSGTFNPLCYADRIVGFGEDGYVSGKPWETMELSNMLFSAKGNGDSYHHMNSYRIPLERVKDIRLFPAGKQDVL